MRGNVPLNCIWQAFLEVHAAFKGKQVINTLAKGLLQFIWILDYDQNKQFYDKWQSAWLLGQKSISFTVMKKKSSIVLKLGSFGQKLYSKDLSLILKYEFY